MLRNLLSLPLAIFFFASPAQAAEWWWVTSAGEKPDRNLEFVDKESATSDYSGRISAWTLRIYEIPQKNGVRTEKNLYRYNCKTRTISLIESIEYGNNNRLLKSYSWNSYEQTERNLVPESVGEGRWQFVCQGKSLLTTSVQSSPEEFAAFFFRTE